MTKALAMDGFFASIQLPDYLNNTQRKDRARPLEQSSAATAMSRCDTQGVGESPTPNNIASVLFRAYK